ASSLLGEIAQFVGEIKELDASADLDDSRLIDALDVVQDMDRALGRYGESIEENPASVEATEERLFLLADLKRKYGGTVQAVMEYRDAAARTPSVSEHREEQKAELRREAHTAA